MVYFKKLEKFREETWTVAFKLMAGNYAFFGKRKGEYEAMTLLHVIKEKGYNFFKSSFQDMICLKEKILDLFLSKQFFF